MSSKAVLLAVLIACVCVCVIAVHWPALAAQALSFDDEEYLLENQLVKNPGWKSTERFLTEVLYPSSVRGYYQPLAMISLMADYAMGGREDNLMPFRLTSLALHIANTILIILLLYQLFDNTWAAAATGLLFGLHPMTVESIPWLAERKTLLAAFFALWSLIFYIRFSRSRGRGNYGFCMMFFILALLSKPTTTPLPILMLLLDYWPLKRLSWKAVIEKIPFLCVSFLSAVITFLSQANTAAVIMPGQHSLLYIPYIITHNIIFYLYKFILPIHLSAFYPFPSPFTIEQPVVLAGVIGTAVLLIVLAISLRWTRAMATGWLFFFVAVFPSLGIIGFHPVIAADRHAYLPMVGFLLPVAVFLSTIFRHERNILQRYVIGAVLLVILYPAEIIGVRHYLVNWRDTVTLYKDMLSLTPNYEVLHNNLGVVYSNLGRYQDAVEAYKQAIRIKPDYAEAHCNLGVTYGKLGRYQDAIESYQKAIRIKPDYAADAYYNLGVAYSKFGRHQEAIEAYKQAIRIKSDYAEAHCNLGVAYGALGRHQDAIESYQQTIRIKPDDAKAHYNLGAAYGRLGRYQDAIEAYKQAIRIKPDYADAHCNLGVAYKSLGRYQDAIESYKQAIRIKPDLAEAHYNLGNAYLLSGDKESALEEYKILKTLDAELANKLFNLINK